MRFTDVAGRSLRNNAPGSATHSGGPGAFSSRQAETLNSGILLRGSSVRCVSRFALRFPGQWYGRNTVSGRIVLLSQNLAYPPVEVAAGGRHTLQKGRTRTAGSGERAGRDGPVQTGSRYPRHRKPTTEPFRRPTTIQ